MNRLGAGPFLLLAIVFATSAVGVALFRVWSNRRGLLDLPNERSSHSTPTPRGGGLIIVLISLCAYVSISIPFNLPLSWGYLFSAGLVAVVSWLDDLWSLPFWTRLIVHIAAAVVLTSDVGAWSELTIPLLDYRIETGFFVGRILAVLWLVWFLNAYNFMDGIDGIASLQAVIAGIAWAVLATKFDLPATAILGAIVASATAGFLIHNWQPARVFMGDVGSAFLGFTLAALPLLGRAESGSDIPLLPSAGILFVWLFLFDTIFTLIRRLLERKRVWEAHREHIYQKLIIDGWQHAHVTLAYGVASSILALLVILGVFLPGTYSFLAFLFVVLLTSLMIYVGMREKR